MCGICGAIGIDPQRNPEAVVRRMLAAIVHRGPDEEGQHRVKTKRTRSSPSGSQRMQILRPFERDWHGVRQFAIGLPDCGRSSCESFTRGSVNQEG